MWYQLTIECLYMYTLTAGVHLGGGGGGGIYQALCKDSLEDFISMLAPPYFLEPQFCPPPMKSFLNTVLDWYIYLT